MHNSHKKILCSCLLFARYLHSLSQQKLLLNKLPSWGSKTRY